MAISKVEQAELASPSPRKVLADRTIYLSYTMPTTYNPPVITDFGAARLGDPGQKHSGGVMPGVFRAPEIIAGMEWDSKIDIWSVGVMVRITTPQDPSHTSLFDTSVDLEPVRRRQSLLCRQGRPSER